MKKYVLGALVLTIFLFSFTHAQTPALDPIVIVPGIGASWNWDVMLDPTPTPQLENWKFVPGVRQYSQLIKALEDKGLVLDEDFFIAFYDWRQSSIDSAQDYLAPIVERALANSETGQVDIITHSMGGLVARAYLQGEDDRDDIDQFIMLGTPNHGSADVYTLWEGGRVPRNWDDFQRFILGFYLSYNTVVSGLTADGYDTIHLYVPSVGEMMPTYDFLHDKDTNNPIVVDDMQEQNLFLQVLNLPDNVGSLAFRTNKTTIVAGEGEETVGAIPVVPHTATDGKLWVDGKPDPLSPVRDDTNGDNRVLVASAHFDFGPPPQESYNPNSLLQRFVRIFIPIAHAQFFGPFDQEVIISKHGDLPTMAIETIFDILELGDPVTAYAPIPEPEEVLSFWIASPVDVEVRSPSGGIVSGANITIPNAFFDAEDDPLGVKFIYIENPEAGEYKVELNGLADGTYHLGVGAFSEQEENVQTVMDTVEENQKITYRVGYEPGNLEAVEILPENEDVEPPVITITQPEIKDYLRSKKIPVDVSAEDEDSGVFALETYLDGILIPNTGTVDFFLKSLGTHAVAASSTDNLGNATSTTRQFRVVATPDSTLADFERVKKERWMNFSTYLILNAQFKTYLNIAKSMPSIFKQNLGPTLLNQLKQYRGRGLSEQGYQLLKEDIEWLMM